MTSALSRRRFLQGGAALGALTLAACHDDGAPDHQSADTKTSTTSSAGGTTPLVVITLSGGNDALNTVVPISEPLYASLRAGVALDPGETLPIGDGFALHPALGRCKALWDAGQLAVVHGVGFDGLDRSHFHCMDEWQAAGDDHRTGWLGRWLDLAGHEPLDAVVVGTKLPLLARGAKRSAAVVPPGPFTLPGDAGLRSGVTAISREGDDRSSLEAIVARSTADLLATVDQLAPVLGGSEEDESLAAQLGTVATLIEAGVPTRAFAVALDGFDTHAGQLPTQTALLSELDAALGDFLDRVGPTAATVLVYSEFGRRVAPNASAGTDHGAAGTVLLAGRVRAGHHGEPPPLDRLDEGDLTTTTDFRAVYGGLLEGVLGIEAADVIERAPTPLPVV